MIKIERVIRDNIALSYSTAFHGQIDLWFIHGLGEAGNCFFDVFNSILVSDYNLYIPDMPGFGDSRRKTNGMESLVEIIKSFSQSRPVILIGHSLGSLWCLKSIPSLGDQVVAFVNVEGNLTKDDCFLSSMALKHSSAAAFKNDLLMHVRSLRESEGNLQRYYQNLKKADEQMCYLWSLDSLKETGEELAGITYDNLTLEKIYFWGRQSLGKRSLAFLQQHQLLNQCFEHSGHWPMIDETDLFYTKISQFISNLKSTSE